MELKEKILDGLLDRGVIDVEERAAWRTPAAAASARKRGLNIFKAVGAAKKATAKPVSASIAHVKAQQKGADRFVAAKKAIKASGARRLAHNIGQWAK